MATLREIIIENVGNDVADAEYFRQLGYAEHTLSAEIGDPVLDTAEITIWEVPGGYHVSTDHHEAYSEDPVADGYVTAHQWEPRPVTDETERLLKQPRLIWGYFLRWVAAQSAAPQLPPRLLIVEDSLTGYELRSPILRIVQDTRTGVTTNCDQVALWQNRKRLYQVLAEFPPDTTHAWKRGGAPTPFPGMLAELMSVEFPPIATVRTGTHPLEAGPESFWNRFLTWAKAHTDCKLDETPRLYLFTRNRLGAYRIERDRVYWHEPDDFWGNGRRLEYDDFLSDIPNLAEVQAYIYYPRKSCWRNPIQWPSVALAVAEMSTPL